MRKAGVHWQPFLRLLRNALYDHGSVKCMFFCFSVSASNYQFIALFVSKRNRTQRFLRKVGNVIITNSKIFCFFYLFKNVLQGEKVRICGDVRVHCRSRSTIEGQGQKSIYTQIDWDFSLWFGLVVCLVCVSTRSTVSTLIYQLALWKLSKKTLLDEIIL